MIVVGELTDCDELLDDLEHSIRLRFKSSTGLRRSNIGSWHSDTDMLNWGGAAAQKVAETAIKLAMRMTSFKDTETNDFDWRVQMWANVTPGGGMNESHVHPGNLWAAVLYLRTGDEKQTGPDVGGNLYLEDPRFPLNLMRNTGARLIGLDGNPQQIQPEFRFKRGNMLVFPAWLRHGVRTYHGTQDRITIAINLDAVQHST